MIIDLPDGQEIDLPDDAPPELREQVKQKIRLKYGASPGAEGGGAASSPLSRAGAYLLKRGKGFATALSRLTSMPGQPNTVGQVASDVAEVGGPLLALSAGPVAGPAIVGGGLAAGAAGAAAGMKHPELAEAGVNVLGGAVSGGVNVYRGIKSARSLGALGEDAKDVVPAASTAAREAFQARTYGKIGEAAAERGLRVRPFSEGGEALKAQLTAALEKWPAGSLERNEAQALLAKLAPTMPQGVRGVNATVLGGPTYAELDAAARNLAGIRHASGVRQAIGAAKDQLLEGTALAAAKRAADVQWGKIIRPVKTIGLQVQNAKYHPDAIKAAVFGWRKLTPAQRAVLDPNGAVAKLVAQAEPGMPMGLAGRIVGGGSAAAVIGASANQMWNGDFENGFKTLLFGLPGAALAAAPATAGMVGTGFAAGVGRGIAGAAGAVVPTLRENAPQTSPEPLGAPGGRQEANGPDPQGEQAETVGYPSPAFGGGPRRGGVARWGTEIDAAARVAGIPARLIGPIMQRESGGNPRALSPQGAVGLMQVLPDTFETMRRQVERLNGREPGTASVHDPLDNLVAGALYLRQGLDRFGGDVEATARYYHGGPNQRIHGPKTQAYGAAIRDAFNR